MMVAVMEGLKSQAHTSPVTLTPFERLVASHLRLLELRTRTQSEVSAAEDASSFGDPLLAEQHFSNANLYRTQVEGVLAAIQKQYRSAPELKRMSDEAEAEARARYESAS